MTDDSRAPQLWLNLNTLPGHALLASATAAEHLGFTGVTLGEHLLRPPLLTTSRYPYTGGARGWQDTSEWVNPWVAFGAMSVLTSTLRFCTAVVIAPAHDTLELAKAVASADFISQGRVSLGAGIGWLREDYDFSGRKFACRGASLDGMIATLCSLWAGEEVVVRNRDRIVRAQLSEPLPARPIPVLVGGHSVAALKRAARADGWIGSNVDLDDVKTAASIIKRDAAERGDTRPKDIIVMLSDTRDLGSLRAATDHGATGLNFPAAQYFDRQSGLLDTGALSEIVAAIGGH